MLIYPKREYEIKVDESIDDSAISLRFLEKPEDMVRMVFQVAKFRVKGDGSIFHTTNPDLIEFGKEMAACLRKGCFPKEIPYVPSHPVAEKSYKTRRYGFVDVKYNNSDGKAQNRRILVFETKKVIAEPLAWIDTHVKITADIVSSTLDTSSNVGQAETDFDNGHYLASMPSPFGSGIESIENSKSNSMLNSELNSKLNSEPNSELNSKSNSEETQSSNANNDGASRLNSEPNSELNSEPNSELNSKSNSELNSEPNSELNSSTLKRHTGVHSFLESLDIEPITTYTVPKLPVDKENRKNNRPHLHASINQPFTNNYLKLHELVPNVVQELQEGKGYYTAESKGFMDLTFDFLSMDTEGRYKVAIAHRYEQNRDLVPDPDMEIRIDPFLQTVEALSYRDMYRFDEVYEETDQGTAVNRANKKDLNEFLTLWLKNLVNQGFFVDLSQVNPDEEPEKEERNYIAVVDEESETSTEEGTKGDSTTNNSVAISSSHLVQLSSVKLSTDKWVNGSDYFQQTCFNWDAAKRFYEEVLSAQGEKGKQLNYEVKWDEGVGYNGKIKFTSEEIENGESSKSLQFRIIEDILDDIHRYEGRFIHLGIKPQEELNPVLHQIIDEHDFGLDTLPIMEQLLPRVPVEAIEVDLGSAELANYNIFGKEYKFGRASERLNHGKESFQFLDEIVIKVRWKDGQTFETTLAPTDIEKPYYPETWRDLFEKSLGEQLVQAYQWKDYQALLFPTEVNKLEPTLIHKSLLTAQWQADELKTAKFIYLHGIKYNQSRLRDQLIVEIAKKSDTFIKNILAELGITYTPLMEGVDKVIKSIEEERPVGIKKLVSHLTKGFKHLDESFDNEGSHYRRICELVFDEADLLVDVPKPNEKKKQNKKSLTQQVRIETNKKIKLLIDEKGDRAEEYTEEDKELLKSYSGYGGLKVEGINTGALSEYYTPEPIVQKMWELAYFFGYSGGDYCEPSVGIGNFLKYAPKTAKGTAYEKDYYSATITKILYPEVTVINDEFESNFFKGNLHVADGVSNDRYDLVIGNPPYGDFRSKYAGMGERKHTKAQDFDQYFITRGLDLLRSEGLLVYIISSYFIRSPKAYNKVKWEIASKSRIMDSYRLPNKAFEYTEVGTDILILQKR